MLKVVFLKLYYDYCKWITTKFIFQVTKLQQQFDRHSSVEFHGNPDGDSFKVWKLFKGFFFALIDPNCPKRQQQIHFVFENFSNLNDINIKLFSRSIKTCYQFSGSLEACSQFSRSLNTISQFPRYNVWFRHELGWTLQNHVHNIPSDVCCHLQNPSFCCGAKLWIGQLSYRWWFYP